MIVFAQAGQAVGPLGFVDALIQFGMAGAVIVVVAVFIWYIDRRERRQESLDEKHYAVIDGLKTEVATLAGTIARLDSHIQELRPGRRGQNV